MSAQPRNAEALIAIEEKWSAHNYHPLNVVLAKGEGCWVWDVEGNRYLDCLAAYSAVNQGHCHPRLVKVMTEQLQKMALSSRAFRNDQFGPWCQEICELTGFDRVLPMCTGAEAVETAVKAARKWGYKVKGVPEGKAEIIVFSSNFHGRTTTIVSFSDDPQYRDGFGPFTPGFHIVPYGDVAAVEKLINPNTVAVLMEPVQGEGGVIIPPAGTLAKLRDITAKNRVLLILDEIQSGLGRTGKLFAFMHDGIRPDAITVGKALSGGMYPVSALLASHEVMGVFHPGDHGSTYGGSALGAAVSREALKVLVEEGLIENAAVQGARIRDGIGAMSTKIFKEIRQIGLWIGLELHPEAGGARRFCEALMKEGMLCKETHVNTIRIAPPLVIKTEEVDWALGKMNKVFTTLG